MHALYSLLSLAIMMLDVHDSCTAMPAEEDGTCKSATEVHNLHRRSPASASWLAYVTAASPAHSPARQAYSARRDGGSLSHLARRRHYQYNA